MATVRAEAAPVAPLRRSRDRLGDRLRRWWRGLAALLCVPRPRIAVLILLVAGIATGYLVRGADDELERVLPREAGAGARPTSRRRSSATGDAAILHVNAMPALAGDQVYEVWVQRAGVMEPRSTFVLKRDGSAEAAIPGPFEGANAVFVTAEPRPGTNKPTTTPLLSAPLRLSRPRYRPRRLADVLPTSGAGDERLLLELRAPDLPRLHDLDPGRDALPGMRAPADQGQAPWRSCHAAPTRRPRSRSIAICVAAFIAEIAAGGANPLNGGGRLITDGGLYAAAGRRRRVATGSSPRPSCTPGSSTSGSTCSRSTSSAPCSSRRSARSASPASTSSRSSAARSGSLLVDPNVAHGRGLGRSLRADGRPPS